MSVPSAESSKAHRTQILRWAWVEIGSSCQVSFSSYHPRTLPRCGHSYRGREHIYRAHAMPIYCARCCVVFKTETDLTAHQRLPRSCGIGSAALPEGFTKEQEKKLKKRTRTTASEEEKWRAMYTVIFPFDDLETIPTPCKIVQHNVSHNRTNVS